MRRLVAIAVAGALAAGSASARESCAMMRAQALERCCCPEAPAGHATLTCCEASLRYSTAAGPRDREPPQPQLVPVLTSAPWSLVNVDAPLAAANPHAVLASAAGPPPLPLRI